jgi:transposase
VGLGACEYATCAPAFPFRSRLPTWRLQALVKDRNAPQKHVWRAQIVLLTGEGVGTIAIMRETGKSKTCVWRWQGRFAVEGFEGLLRDKTRPSRIPKLDPTIAERIVALTMEAPPGEITHWTGAAMAEATGVSVSSVQRIWRAHGLQPHRIRQFKLSKDPEFVDKLRDVVALYVDPPAHAVVLSVDERHGTTTLFAAMNVLDGTVIGCNMQRHRHQKFIHFLTAVEREVPAGKTVHAILDNYAAHKHPAVRQWIARHPRWTFHFTPTSASWLNAVEGFFAMLTKRRLKRGVFRSVADLQAAINRFLDDHNVQSKPFQWVADPDEIIAAVRRGHQALDSIH